VGSKIATFMVNKETLKINLEILRKGERQMPVFNGEHCQNQLDNEISSFDPKIQLCTMHEPLSAKVKPEEDAQPVLFKKYSSLKLHIKVFS
jgi:hypothetical protein